MRKTWYSVSAEPGNALSRAAFPTMNTEHICTCYEKLKEAMVYCDSGNERIENRNRNPTSLVGLVQFFTTNDNEA